MNIWFAILRWGVVFFFIALFGRQLAKKWFGSHSETLGIPLFLLVWVYFYWCIGSIFHVTENGVTSFLTFAITCFFFVYKTKKEISVDHTGWGILVGFFIVGLWIRAYSPFLDVAERLPDMMLFQSLANDVHFPPQDRWLAGHTLNYYYFGQLLFVPWMKLAQVPAEIAFNLSTCTLWALIASSAYAIVRMLEAPMWVGIASTFGSALFSNWEWIRQMIQKGWGRFYWWDSSRAMQGTITEFPFFSFLLGDFHAHYIAIPWLSLSLVLFLAFRKKQMGKRFLLVLSLAIGVHYILNPWEFPWIALLFLLLCFQEWKKSILPVVGAFLLFSPFWYQYERPVSYIGWVSANLRSPIHLFFLHWGIFLIPLLMIVYLRGRSFFKRKTWLQEEKVLLVISLLCILTCEFIHLDNFYGPDLARMNTVFKFYTIAWWGLGISVPLILWKERDVWLHRPWIKISFVIFSLCSLFYPIFGTRSRLAVSTEIPTLNGIAHWRQQAPGEEEVVRWIIENTNPNDVVFEAIGPAYQRYGRMSALSGRPTILGWDNHQWVWRRNGHELTLERENDFKAASEDATGQKMDQLIQKYNVKWIVVGELERKSLSFVLLEKIYKYKKTFEKNGVQVFEVSRSS